MICVYHIYQLGISIIHFIYSLFACLFLTSSPYEGKRLNWLKLSEIKCLFLKFRVPHKILGDIVCMVESACGAL